MSRSNQFLKMNNLLSNSYSIFCNLSLYFCLNSTANILLFRSWILEVGIGTPCPYLNIYISYSFVFLMDKRKLCLFKIVPHVTILSLSSRKVGHKKLNYIRRGHQKVDLKKTDLKHFNLLALVNNKTISYYILN